MSAATTVRAAILLALTAAGLGGCAVHSQAPIKEVAYDFSDRDFYDRSYAPSPAYEAGAQPVAEAPLRPASRADQAAEPAAAVQVQVNVNVLAAPAQR